MSNRNDLIVKAIEKAGGEVTNPEDRNYLLLDLISATTNGGGGASVANDMYFSSNAERDAFTSSNPDRIKQGITCAVESGVAYNYFQWDDLASQWRDANLIFQGKKGDQGKDGDPGEKGDTVKISTVKNELDGTGKLKTTVSLDDGTTAASEPLQLPEGAEINLDGKVVGTIYTESSIDALIEDDVATLSVNNKVSHWPIELVGIGDSPKQIDKIEQLGIEYQFGASSTLSQSMILYHTGLPEGAQIKVTVVDVKADSKPIDVFQLGGLQWPVTTPTVFTLRAGYWRVEESSQMLHVQGSTTYAGSGAEKRVIHGIAADPSSDITMAVSDDGLLVIGRKYTPPTDTIDIAFWWTDNEQPDANDILNAMSQTQTPDVVSHTDNFYRGDLQSRTMTAKRDEHSFKYLFFAWHKGFFNPEPTKIDTGWGSPSSWVESEVSVNGEAYKVLTVEVKNNVKVVEDYALIQEGVR